jgi:hypothetical protein
MTELVPTVLTPCARPSDAQLEGLLTPYRPFPEGNGWYAHFFYHSDGRPAWKRLTHGDHDDIWYIASSAGH